MTHRLLPLSGISPAGSSEARRKQPHAYPLLSSGPVGEIREFSHQVHWIEHPPASTRKIELPLLRGITALAPTLQD